MSGSGGRASERSSGTRASVGPGSGERGTGDGLTVGQVAERLHVSVRTLHHWDEIGLARPGRRTRGGYRLYTATDLERLQRIVVYRELGLDLEAIRAVLDDAATAVPAALRDQRERLTRHIDELERMRTGLDRMLEAHEHGIRLTVEQQAAVFGPEWDPSWTAQAHARWGDSEQWTQFAERSAGRGPDEWREVTDEITAFEDELAAAMDAGVQPGEPEVARLADRHREVFGAFFPLTREMQVCLGRMYESDPAFATHYEGIRPGLAGWLRRIIDEAARSEGIDPDTATWR